MSEPLETVRGAASAAFDRDVRLGRVSRRRWSWLIDLETDSGRYLVKIPRWAGIVTLEDAIAAGPQHKTRNEADVLDRLHGAVRSAGEEGLGAIGVAAYVPEINGIVMERFPGRPLRSRMRPGADLDAEFFRIGRLLRLFHSLGEARRVDFDSAAATDSITATVSDVPPGRRRHIESATHAVVAAMSRVLPDGSEPWGPVHGDLNVDNVLVADDGTVALVDPNPEEGPLLVDQSLMIGDVLLDRLQMVTSGRWRSPQRSRGWIEAFVDGTGLGNEPLRTVREAMETIERWSRVEQKDGPLRRLVARSSRPLFAERIRRLTDPAG
jgi:hypothetical protein